VRETSNAMKLRSLSLSTIVLALASENTLAQGLPRSAVGNWIISETTSPVDYTPVVIAVARSKDNAEHSATELSIICRNGRTSLLVTGGAMSGRHDDYVISYRINRNNPVEAGTSSASLGGGVSVHGDVVRLLQSFPNEGEIAIRLAVRNRASHEAIFSLDGFNGVKSRMARACNWPKPAN
jgi:hypothetical protein